MLYCSHETRQKLKLGLPSDLVLGDSPNHPKNPQACLQSKSRDNPYTSTVIHNSQGERRSPRTSSTH